MRKEVQECLPNMPHWPALRARAASIESKGQWAVTRPDTLQPLGYYIPTSAHQRPAPSRQIVERSPGTRAKKTDSTVNKKEPFVYCLLGMQASSKGALWVRQEHRTQSGDALAMCSTIPARSHQHHIIGILPSGGCDLRSTGPAWILQLRDHLILLSQARSPKCASVVCT